MARQFIVDGKFLGEFDGDILRKKVQFSKHYMRKYDAWGIDKDMFDQVREDLKEIRILDSENNILYTADVDVALQGKIVGEFEGYGMQVFLPRRNFIQTEFKPKTNHG